MDCYSTLVGFSSTPCNCIEGGTTSLSGLFIDDVSAGTIPLNQAVFNCNETTMENMLSTLIENATVEAIRELKKATSKSLLRKRYEDINSTVGKVSGYTAGLDASADWFYMTIKPRSIKGGYYKLNEINIHLFTGSFTGTVKVIDESGTELFSDDIANFTGLKLKLDQSYYIAYQTEGNPKNFKHTLCCGYTPTHLKYISIGSGTVSDLANLEYQENQYCQGIELKGFFYCDGFDFICDIDYENSDFGMVFAKAVQQIARKNLAYWMLTNDKITPYTSYNREQLTNLVEFLHKDISENINYLPYIYNHSDCYSCGSYVKGQIII